MNLHRTSGRPDWENVDPAARNMFQKLAAATHGTLAPANVITMSGLVAVIFGLSAILHNHFWLGLVLLAGGRLLDVVDGVAAEATQTKSPLGESLDAAVDKIGTMLTIIMLFIAGITYWWVLALLLVPQVITPLVAFYKKRKGKTIHPTRQGKLSMATAWIGIVGLLVVKALETNNGVSVITSIVYTVIGMSFVLGVYALWQYSTGRD